MRCLDRECRTAGRSPVIRLASVWWLLCLVAAAGVQAQGPPAGTPIQNRGKATYLHPDTGVVVELDSNPVTVVVQPLEALVLTQDQTREAAIGTIVHLPHRLTNTGNVTSSYTFWLENLRDDDADLGGLRLVRDVNGNGRADDGEPTILAGERPVLAAGASLDLVIVANFTLPVNQGSQIRIALHVLSELQGLTATNIDTIVATGTSALALLKSVTPARPDPGELATYTLVVSQTRSLPPDPVPVMVDGAERSLIWAIDRIPINTEFHALAEPGGGTALYHVRGAPPGSYQSSPPPNPALVDEVGYGMPGLLPTDGFRFSVTVKVMPTASGDIVNVAAVHYRDRLTGQLNSTASNAVSLPIPCQPPQIVFFTDGTFSVRTGVGQVGSPLFCEIIKGAGNLLPDVVETIQVEFRSSLTGDVEVFTAVESGPNTGVFLILPDIPTTGASRAPNDGVLETGPNDTITTSTASCEGGIREAQLLISPSNVIYDSISNLPLAGAQITLIDVTGASNGGRPGEPAVVLAADGVSSAPNAQTTTDDSRFAFPWLPPGTYRVDVVPPAPYGFASQRPPDQQPAERVVDAAGSYGLDFEIVVGGNTVRFDVPLDAPPPTGLFIEKTASRNVAEIGDFLDYRITIRNTNITAATSPVLTDNMPQGFAYQTGSARLDNDPIPEPVTTAGGILTFTLPDLPAQGEAFLTYRVRITSGATPGQRTNRASIAATSVYGPLASNTSAAVVELHAGVFSERGVLIGMVFVDQNGNRRLDPDEPGVPDVRVWLEDGTYAITDADGKYSLYGLRPGTRVAKVDVITLPSGSTLEPLTHRHGDDGGSRFVDLKNGELHKANFALRPVAEDVLAQIRERAKARTAAAPAPDVESRISADGTPTEAGDTRGRPSAGVLTNGEAAPATPGSQPEPLPALSGNTPVAAVRPVPSVPLEAVVTGQDNTLAFLDLADGDTLPMAQVNVRVKGASGGELRLFLNGEQVADDRLGSRLELPDQQLEGREYIGLNLVTGPNRLELAQYDAFGNERRRVSIEVIAPGQAGELRLRLPQDEPAADGQSRQAVVIELVDGRGVRVSARTPVTLSSSAGQWDAKDLDGIEPGLQLFLEGGRAEVPLVAPDRPAVAEIVAVSGQLKATGRLAFVPHLRPLTGAGVLEAKFTLRGSQGGGLFNRPFDPFENELRTLVTGSMNGTGQLGARAAMFFKGRVMGDWLLTVGFDSEKQKQERLLRDIQPDEYYPVYGDGSTKGYEAQSTGRLFARLDKGQSYLLYGDFTTRGSSPARSLGAYYRSLSGVQGHWQAGMLDVDVFASHDNARQVIEEFQATGTSGPFLLGIAPIRDNSERVEILVRDRNQPSLILSTTPQQRFTDYEIEPLTGRIIFRVPIPTLDPDFNPISVRVSYEVEQAGKQFWTYGVEGALRLARNFELGGSWIQDENPVDPTRLRSANLAWTIDPRTLLVAEMAETRRAGLGVGQGVRFDLTHRGPRLTANVYAGSTDANFDNPSAVLNRGRREYGLKTSYLLDNRTRLAFDAIRTEDVTTAEKLDGLEFTAERALNDRLAVEFGLRHAKGSIAATVPGATGETATEFTTLRGRLTGQLPGKPEASVYGEYEQDVTDWSKRVLALGGDVRLNNRTKLYARHELLSSIGGRYLLSDDRTQNSTIVGVESEYLRDAHLFSEYRSFDGLSGRETEAAVGLRNRWQVARGIALHTSFENIQGLAGRADNDATSFTAAVEYTADRRWLGSARAEYRNASSTDSFLATLGLARRLSNDWTLLGKYLFSGLTYSTGGARTQQRLRVGAAYRDSERDVFNGLFRYEFLSDRDSTAAAFGSSRTTHILSTDLGVQLTPRTELHSRYAMKHVNDRTNTLNDSLTTYLLGGRITQDIGNRFDLGLNGSALFGDGGGKWAVGLEGGFLFTRDLWLSAGYNWSGFRDDELAADAYTDQGPYLRLRFKFDEGLFR